MTKTRMWMVRAGRGADRVEEFLDDKLVAIGWGNVGPLYPGISREDVIVRIKATSPTDSPGRIANAAGQIYRFLSEIQIGDYVCTYDPGQRRYCLGTVLGDAENRDHILGRYREVSWTHHVLRDSLSPGTRNSLGAILTLFLVPDVAAKEMRKRAVDLGEELSAELVKLDSSRADAEDSCGDSIGYEGVQTRSAELIDDAIVSLGWEDMQELMAGILRAMGYRAIVSPKGPDRGVDIVASPDGLGLEEPRIFVEVKHRQGKPMGSQALRAFLGGRQRGDKCLYLSTGGFTKEARYEADRSKTPVTLIDLPRLRDLLVEHYHSLEPAAAALVPLHRLYWPVRL